MKTSLIIVASVIAGVAIGLAVQQWYPYKPCDAYRQQALTDVPRRCVEYLWNNN